MSEQTLQAVAIQKTLELTEQEALKVLVFITGIEVGRELQFSEKAANGKHRNPTKQLI